MAPMPIEACDTIPIATEGEAFEAFDYTCRYYLDMSGEEFLVLWNSGQIPESDDPRLQRVLEMMSVTLQ